MMFPIVQTASEQFKDILLTFSMLSEQVFVRKYLVNLPSETELIAEIEREKLIIAQRFR